MGKIDDLIQRFLGEPAKNLMHAMYDDYVEANVRFRSRSGMKTFIIRRQLRKCCDWCAGLAGIYESDKAPDGVYQRHDNCKCMVTFRNEEGKYTDAWTKTEYSSQRAARKARQRELINDIETQEQTRKKRVDIINKAQYYNSPSDKELNRRYTRDVEQGWISPLCGFQNYKNLYYDIQENVIGLKTPSGITIRSQSEHFLARVIGTQLNPDNVKNGVYFITKKKKIEFKSNARNGVSVNDIVDAIQNGRLEKIIIDKDGLKSQRIAGKNCKVTFNPDTGKLIQCNPGGD